MPNTFIVINGEGSIPSTATPQEIVQMMDKHQREDELIGFKRPDGRMIWRRRGLILGFDVPAENEKPEGAAEVAVAEKPEDNPGFDASTDQDS